MKTRYTPTEQKILQVLSDGMSHERCELYACLMDPESKPTSIRQRISSLRKKLRPKGEDVICELNRGIYYRHVRMLASAVDGNQ